MIERRKVFDEQFFCCERFLIASAIRHWLGATGLIKGVDDIYLQLLEKLQRGDTDFRIEEIDITRDHQGDLHV
jgi:hypothetical protein